MSTIMHYSDEMELGGPPSFECGNKVRALRVIRNDGTFPGKEIGEVLAKRGELGYVTSIGTFLQKFYIYGVEFIETGHRVRMKSRELVGADTPISEGDADGNPESTL